MIKKSPFLSQTSPICPKDLLNNAKNKLIKPRIAIASAGHMLPMAAAKEAVLEGIMTPIFVGEEALIKLCANDLNWDISNFQIIHTTGEVEAAETAARLCGDGQADILMKGHIHSDLFIKSVLDKGSGLRTKQRLIHVFYISHPDGGNPLLISDAAVNVSPDLQTRKDATIQIVKLLRSLGNKEPRIAFLSATESVLESVPSSVDANTLYEWCIKNISAAHFSGPLALDTLLSYNAAITKGLQGNPVVGRPDAIIVPDIVSGNVLFKSLVYLSGGCAAGIVLGAKVPLLLTSRADPPAARLASIALATLISKEERLSDN
jgi:phosphate acetyltransferase